MPVESPKPQARCIWRLLTPHSAGGAAIAIFELLGDVDWALSQLGLAPVPVGAFSLRNFGGLDRGVVARWSTKYAHLMPHGGAALLAQITPWLDHAGVQHLTKLDSAVASVGHLRTAFPEAASDIEALALATLPHAASPAAIDLLLRQHQLWWGCDIHAPRTPSQAERDRVLARLLTPPLIVIAGVPNVGKSRLMNALAGQTISIVSDLPGTTRDHVGIHAICDTVAVRLVDTPGLRSTNDPIESEAQMTANALLGSADLVLACSDPEHPAPSDLSTHYPRAAIIPVRTKSDLFGPDLRAEYSVSAATGDGIASLASGVSERLIPKATRDLSQPWRFWA